MQAMRWLGVIGVVVSALLLACAGIEKKPGLIEYVQAQTAPGIELKVMTFNIRYGTADDGPNSWKFRREFVAEICRAGGYDVIGLQEALADQIDFLLANVPGYASVGVGRDDGARKGEFSPILYRPSRFDLAESGTFWFSDTPEKPGSKGWGANLPRVCTWAKLVEKASGRAVWVYNMHLDHQSAYSRERSVELLAQRIRSAGAGSALVVTGDFNAGEGSAPVRYLKGGSRRATPPEAPGQPAREVAESPDLLDTFRVVHPDATDVCTFNDFKGVREGEKIDYILTPRGTLVNGAEIIRAERGGRYPSDHYPVTASVKVMAK